MRRSGWRIWQIGGFWMLLGLIGFALLWFAPLASAGSISVETIQGPSIAQVIWQKFASSWPWYLVRGSGLVAAATLVILMLSGIGQITGYTYRFLEPLTAWASHRALGLVMGVSVLIHMFGLLFDHFLPFSLPQILVPWLSQYKPVTWLGVSVGSVYVAMGILAFYLTLAVAVTSLIWVEKKPQTWKLIHLASYIVITLVFVHALYIGTDLAHGWMRWAWVAGGVATMATSLLRLWRARTT